MFKKLRERSPLRLMLTRDISCLSPFVISKSFQTAVGRMDRLLQTSIQQKHISDNTADKVKRQYSILIQSDSIGNFKIEQRLDTFWFEMICEKNEFLELWKVAEIVLTLSHGNA